MVRISHIKCAVLLTLSFSISGCAGTLIEAPSLNKRAFEISLEEMRSQADGDNMASDSIVIVGRETPEAVLPKLDNESRLLWRQHKKADGDFETQSQTAQAAVRKAGSAGFGGDSWAEAHVALSRLDRTRSPSLTSLSEIDAQIFKRLENSGNDRNDDELLKALLQIQQYVEQDVLTQTQFIDALANGLAKR